MEPRPKIGGTIYLFAFPLTKVVKRQSFIVQYSTILSLITRAQSTSRTESEARAVARGKMVWWH